MSIYILQNVKDTKEIPLILESDVALFVYNQINSFNDTNADNVLSLLSLRKVYIYYILIFSNYL